MVDDLLYGCKLSEFFFKVAQIFELPVYRCEPDVGYMVQAFQGLHDQFTDVLVCIYLALAQANQLGFNPICYFFELRGRDRAFVAGHLEFGNEFVPVERFPPTIGFNDHQWGVFDVLICGESPATT